MTMKLNPATGLFEDMPDNGNDFTMKDTDATKTDITKTKLTESVSNPSPDSESEVSETSLPKKSDESVTVSGKLRGRFTDRPVGTRLRVAPLKP